MCVDLPFYLFLTAYTFRAQVGEAAAFVRSADPKLFPNGETSPPSEDSTSGPGAPDLELFVTPLAYLNHGLDDIVSGYLYSLHACLLR